MWPERLYTLAGADIGTQHLNSFQGRVSDSQAATTLTLERTIQEDELWIFYRVVVAADAGAAQICTRLNLQLRDVANNTVISILDRFRDGTSQFATMSTDLHGLPVRGPRIIRADAVFDAAGVANAASLDWNVVRIPRGNWTLT